MGSKSLNGKYGLSVGSPPIELFKSDGTPSTLEIEVDDTGFGWTIDGTVADVASLPDPTTVPRSTYYVSGGNVGTYNSDGVNWIWVKNGTVTSTKATTVPYLLPDDTRNVIIKHSVLSDGYQHGVIQLPILPKDTVITIQALWLSSINICSTSLSSFERHATTMLGGLGKGIGSSIDGTLLPYTAQNGNGEYRFVSSGTGWMLDGKNRGLMTSRTDAQCDGWGNEIKQSANGYFHRFTLSEDEYTTISRQKIYTMNTNDHCLDPTIYNSTYGANFADLAALLLANPTAHHLYGVGGSAYPATDYTSWVWYSSPTECIVYLTRPTQGPYIACSNQETKIICEGDVPAFIILPYNTNITEQNDVLQTLPKDYQLMIDGSKVNNGVSNGTTTTHYVFVMGGLANCAYHREAHFGIYPTYSNYHLFDNEDHITYEFYPPQYATPGNYDSIRWVPTANLGVILKGRGSENGDGWGNECQLNNSGLLQRYTLSETEYSWLYGAIPDNSIAAPSTLNKTDITEIDGGQVPTYRFLLNLTGLDFNTVALTIPSSGWVDGDTIKILEITRTSYVISLGTIRPRFPWFDWTVINDISEITHAGVYQYSSTGEYFLAMQSNPDYLELVYGTSGVTSYWYVKSTNFLSLMQGLISVDKIGFNSTSYLPNSAMFTLNDSTDQQGLNITTGDSGFTNGSTTITNNTISLVGAGASTVTNITTEITNITGRLYIGSDPIDVMEAAPKQYVDAGDDNILFNASTSAQTSIATTITYITGTRLQPTAFKIGSILRWTITATKTGAGTVAPVIDIAFGTAGSTSDTARVSFAGSQTAVADTAVFTITAVICGPLSGSCIVHGTLQCVNHGGEAAGFKTQVIQVASSGFDITTVNMGAGICMTTGSSAVWSIQSVISEVLNV